LDRDTCHLRVEGTDLIFEPGPLLWRQDFSGGFEKLIRDAVDNLDTRGATYQKDARGGCGSVSIVIATFGLAVSARTLGAFAAVHMMNEVPFHK
jgi:hypothetical protein